MLIFNTTFHIDESVHEECIAYLTTIYIPKAIASGALCEPRLALVHRQHEEDGHSYALEFRVADVNTLDNWVRTEGEVLQSEMTSKFGHKLVGFTTLLDEVEI